MGVPGKGGGGVTIPRATRWVITGSPNIPFVRVSVGVQSGEQWCGHKQPWIEFSVRRLWCLWTPEAGGMHPWGGGAPPPRAGRAPSWGSTPS